MTQLTTTIIKNNITFTSQQETYVMSTNSNVGITIALTTLFEVLRLHIGVHRGEAIAIDVPHPNHMQPRIERCDAHTAGTSCSATSTEAHVSVAVIIVTPASVVHKNTAVATTIVVSNQPAALVPVVAQFYPDTDGERWQLGRANVECWDYAVTVVAYTYMASPHNQEN